MPLVRYEVRCEHSLANPELYRTAGRDDSEGLLEGVAMAGLVGIVRQLGDLAEFAAEIFHDLHDDIMTIVSRGQNLKARVARLEVDLPAVEKALLAEASQFRFAYSARSKWRAPLPMDHNLCAQGELPRFVRNFYDDCRGPPRLFLLDKFDEVGRGACVKRYTDPTFFRISWATTQIEKAEQLRREQEAQIQKKNTAADKGTDKTGPKIYARERLSSALFENLEGFTGDFTPELRSQRLDRVLEISTEGDLTPDGPRSPAEPRSPEKPRSPEPGPNFQRRRHLPEVAQGPVLAPLKVNVKDIENAMLGRRILRSNEVGTLSEEEEENSADFYVDALTTMGSDPDSEPGSRGRWDTDSAQSRLAQESDQVTSLNHSVLKAHVEAHRLTPPGGSEVDHEDEFARRLALHEHESSAAASDAVEWESNAVESPRGQASVEDEEPRSVDESNAIESVASAGDNSRNDHASVPEDVHEERQATTPNELPDKVPHKLRDKAPVNNVSDRVSYKVPKVSFMDSDKVPEKPSYQTHESVSLLDSYRASARVKEQRASAEARVKSSPVLENDNPREAEKDNQLALANSDVKRNVEQSVEQIVTTPKSRRLWAKDNGPQVASSILALKLNSGSELNNILRARMLESSGHSHDDLTAVIPHEGEDSLLENPGTQSTYRSSSSNTSSPYTNISTSDVAEEDGYTSSASSSPKGANFGALLSPSESPPRVGRGLMGSPMIYDANPPFGKRSPNLAPPVTPFLSSSPSVTRCPSINDQPSVSSVRVVGHSPRLPPQLIPSPQRDISLRSPQTNVDPVANSTSDSDKVKNVHVVSPIRASENGGLQAEPSKSQPSALPNPVPRPRTWVDRSESNVAATLRAIRQAAAVESDDDTGSECRSDCS